jgi:signal transduction histidine kinase
MHFRTIRAQIWRQLPIGLLVGLLMSIGKMAAQSPLDSMERLLPTATGQDKINLAGELAFQYCYINTDKALQYGRLELQLTLALGDSAQIAQAWNDLAAAYISRGEFEESLVLSQQALGVRERLGDSLKVATTLGRIGHARIELGQLDEALTALIRAARIYEHENKPQLLGMMYNHIGAVHQRQGNHPKAIAYFQKAIAMAEKLRDAASLVPPLSNLGKEYFDGGEKSKAKMIFLRLVRTLDSLGSQENLALITANLGTTYMDEAQYDSAMYFFTAADTLYAAKGDKKGLTTVYVDMGICYTRMKAYDKADKALAEGLRYARETASNWRLHQAYEALHQLAYAKGDYKAAADYMAQMLDYLRQIHNETVNEKVAEMDTRYQTEKKEKDLAVRSKQLADAELKAKTQQLWLFLLAGGLLLVLGVAAYLVRRQRLRRERLEQQSRLALQEERLRISRDLHDHIGAELTLITSSLDVLVAQAPDAPQGKELQEIGGYSRNAMSQLRETIWAIRSETISVDALSLRLMDYAARLCRPAGIVSTVEVEGTAAKPLSPLHTIHVYRMAQEAIHNAVKYAACKTLTILLDARPASLEIRITDDGRGFARERAHTGNGLQNMQARAEELGGSFVLASAPGKGTAVTIRVPI